MRVALPILSIALAGCFSKPPPPGITTGCLGEDDPNFHDEDGDLLDDLCDNCPETANPDQADTTDQDGIGDVCDPHLDAADTRVEIVTFAESFAAQRWINRIGSWTVDRGQLTHPEAPGPFHIIADTTAMPMPQFNLRVRAVIQPPANGNAGFHVLTNIDNASQLGIGCGVFRSGNTEEVRLLDDYQSFAGHAPISELPRGEIVVMFDFAPRSISRCIVTLPDNSVISTSAAIPDEPSGALGFNALSTGVEVLSIDLTVPTTM